MGFNLFIYFVLNGMCEVILSIDWWPSTLSSDDIFFFLSLSHYLGSGLLIFLRPVKRFSFRAILWILPTPPAHYVELRKSRYSSACHMQREINLSTSNNSRGLITALLVNKQWAGNLCHLCQLVQRVWIVIVVWSNSCISRRNTTEYCDYSCFDSILHSYTIRVIVTIRFPHTSILANRKRFCFKWAPKNSSTLYLRFASSRKKGAMIHLKPCIG